MGQGQSSDREHRPIHPTESEDTLARSKSDGKIELQETNKTPEKAYMELPALDEKGQPIATDAKSVEIDVDDDEDEKDKGLLAKAKEADKDGDKKKQTPNQALRYWVAQGNEEKVRELQLAGADVNAPDLGSQDDADEDEKGKKKQKEADNALSLGVAEKITGDYPLHIAAEMGHVALIRTLFFFGAKMENRNRIGSTALHRAVACGQAASVMELLDLGASIKARNTIGNTPLHIATLCGNLDMMKLLLAKGGKEDLRTQNKVFMTPIEYTLEGSPERALLLEYEPSLEDMVKEADETFQKDASDEKQED